MNGLQRVTKARSILVVSQPFFGCLALYLEVIRDDSVDTMAVDGQHLFYNEEFVCSLNEDELVGVNAHEVLHCAYKHMTRRGQRDPDRWNIACDYVVNLDILDAGFTLPTCRLLDEQYRGMSTEEVYTRLPEEKKKGGGGKGDGKGKGKDPGGCGGVKDAANPSDAKTKQEVERKWEIVVRQAVGVAKANQAGKIPSYLENLVKTMNQPRVDWRDLTRRFIDESSRRDYTWSKPNRRYISLGLILPGTIPDGLNHLIAMVDTSGSIWSQLKLLAEFGSEINACLSEGVADKVTIIYVDTKVHKVETFEAGDELIMHPQGGGGTDFTDAFKWLEKNVNDASAIIYFTDMLTSSFGEDPGVPVLWAVYGPSKSFPALAKRAPFGEAIHVM